MLIWLWVGVLAALVILTVVLVYATRRLVGKPVQQLSAALGFLSQGDLTRSVDIRSNDEIGALGQAMEGFRQRLAQSLGTVRRSAESVSSASYEIAQGNQDLSARTETQASSLEETAASMEELAPPFATTPTTPRKPAAWRPAPARWPRKVATWWRRWSAPCTTSMAAARRLPTSLA